MLCIGSMGTNLEDRGGNQMAYGKSDQFIVPKKAVRAGGGKGLAHWCPMWGRLIQTGAEEYWQRNCMGYRNL